MRQANWRRIAGESPAEGRSNQPPSPRRHAPVAVTVLALLVLGVALAPRQLRAEPFDLGLQVLVRIAVPDLHAEVMTQFRNLYKSKF